MGGLFSNQKKEIKNEKEKPIQPQTASTQPQTTISVPSKTTMVNQQPQSKKPFNIQLSEDDKDIYNLNPGDDDEEEEEYEIDEQIPIDSKTKEPNINQNKTNNAINKQIHSEKEIDDNEYLFSTRSNSIPIYIEQKEESNPSKKMKEDPNTYCHRIRKKNTLFSLEEVQYYSIHKIKEKETLLSSFGFIDSKLIKKEYIVFFEESYIYFSKDIAVDKKSKMRKVGNKHSLNALSNIYFEKESKSDILMHLEFSSENEDFGYIQKEFYLDINKVNQFINDLKQRLLLLGIECSSSNEAQDQNQEEDVQNESQKDQIPLEIQLMGE